MAASILRGKDANKDDIEGETFIMNYTEDSYFEDEYNEDLFTEPLKEEGGDGVEITECSLEEHDAKEELKDLLRNEDSRTIKNEEYVASSSINTQNQATNRQLVVKINIANKEGKCSNAQINYSPQVKTVKQTDEVLRKIQQDIRLNSERHNRVRNTCTTQQRSPSFELTKNILKDSGKKEENCRSTRSNNPLLCCPHCSIIIQKSELELHLDTFHAAMRMTRSSSRSVFRQGLFSRVTVYKNSLKTPSSRSRSKSERNAFFSAEAASTYEKKSCRNLGNDNGAPICQSAHSARSRTSVSARVKTVTANVAIRKRGKSLSNENDTKISTSQNTTTITSSNRF